jgi:hypothetical protein
LSRAAKKRKRKWKKFNFSEKLNFFAPRATWPRVRFGDVVSLNTDRAADPLAAGIERFVGLEHIEPEDLRIRRWGQVADGTTFTNRFRPGHVLFGKRRAYQRKVAMAEFESTDDWTANRSSRRSSTSPRS